MQPLMPPPPCSPAEVVSEILHGVEVLDPYRWLEDQQSARTRAWIAEQHRYTRSYFDALAGRDRIQERIRALLDVETCDSIQIAGGKYVFRKRIPGSEQPCIFLRHGTHGEDQLLIDPAQRGTGKYTAVIPLRLSPDGQLLLYEAKQGGERTGTFQLYDVDRRCTLPDGLPRGYLRGFAFAPDLQGFYYVHRAVGSERPHYRAAKYHIFGTDIGADQEVFFAGEDERLSLLIVPGVNELGFLLYRVADKVYTDFYLWNLRREDPPERWIQRASYRFAPRLLHSRLLALTDLDCPNSRIVQVRKWAGEGPEFVDVIPSSDLPIRNWIATENRIYVLYSHETCTEIRIFDSSGNPLGAMPTGEYDTVRMMAASENGEVFFERESFTAPIHTYRYSPENGAQLWARRSVPFDSDGFAHRRVWFTAPDGTNIPMFLVGRPEVLEGGGHPAIMTSYGGYGVPVTPQFSVFVAFLIERGCLFALPNIRGGSEFGAEWHHAARRHNRQVAFNDFIAAAEWLINTGKTTPEKLAIFGGSNAGLLVGAALTQRPDLFRAVVCMVPLLDMLRYHLFDNTGLWKEEFGTAEDREDFAVLAGYSPYHRVRDGVSYPATMIVSGDADQNCNPMHARKMTARLQAANVSSHPILLDYSQYRGHSPVLPLSHRIEALTDRMAFLCDQLQLPV